MKLPSLVTANLPNLGYHLYDASLIRSLYMTDLFPFSLNLVKGHKSEAGFYAILDSGKAQAAKRAFKGMAAKPSSVDDPTMQLGPVREKSNEAHDSPKLALYPFQPQIVKHRRPRLEPGREGSPIASWLPYLPKEGVNITMNIPSRPNCSSLSTDVAKALYYPGSTAPVVKSGVH